MAWNLDPFEGLITRHFRELRAQRELLERIAQTDSTSLTNLAIGDLAQAESTLEDWPVSGARRKIRSVVSNGGTVYLASGVATTIVHSNPARSGAIIVITGSNPVILYLCGANEVGVQAVGQLYLTAGGGSFDFRIGDAKWVGAVSAVAQGGASSLTLVEI